MPRLTNYRQLGRAALLGAAMILATGHYVVAQDTTDAPDPPSTTAPAVTNAAVAAAPTAVPQTEVLPVLDNGPEPGDAFPTEPWGNTE